MDLQVVPLTIPIGNRVNRYRNYIALLLLYTKTEIMLGRELKSFDSLKRGSHVFVICHSNDIELYDFHSFLKNGVDENELVIIFLENCSNYTSSIEESRSITFLNDKNSKKKDKIMIKATEEWYHPDEFLNAEIFLKKWEILVTNAIKNGKEGITDHCRN